MGGKGSTQQGERGTTMRSWTDLRNHSILREDGREIARCDVDLNGFWSWEVKSPKQVGLAIGRDKAKAGVEAALAKREAA